MAAPVLWVGVGHVWLRFRCLGNGQSERRAMFRHPIYQACVVSWQVGGGMVPSTWLIKPQGVCRQKL